MHWCMKESVLLSYILVNCPNNKGHTVLMSIKNQNVIATHMIIHMKGKCLLAYVKPLSI